MDESLPTISNPENSQIASLPEIDIGNRGLKKRILRRGITWQTPFPGDEVQVHYSGCVEDGSSLGSSHESEAPFKFKLGQRKVIEGLDEGVGTMKKGERAIFKVPPHLGYGEVGFAPLVPPNSTLIFDVEMISWNTIRDITGDGGVLKKIISEGEGWDNPKDGDEVLVNYEAKLENGAILSKCESVEFHVGDGKLCPAIHNAVKTMRRNEKAELSVRFSLIYVGKREDGYIFEQKGTKEEPFKYMCLEDQINESLDKAIMSMKKGEKAQVFLLSDETQGNHEALETTTINNTKLLYEVELIDFTKEKPFWKMDTQEKIEACEKKKQEGNALFKKGKFWLASMKYEKAVKCVEFNHTFTEEEKCQAKALLISSNLNNAACKLKLEDYIGASMLCTKVLELDPNNIKALFRRSQAYLHTSDLDKAEIDCKRALMIETNNREIKLVLQEIKAKKKEHALYQTRLFGTMISKMV